ncbi:hypothetical protein AZH53_09050 [Methanomicrobiaceae archaeon CYW5]|nr:hypothetical protein [Methanovulcanius yangii]
MQRMAAMRKSGTPACLFTQKGWKIEKIKDYYLWEIYEFRKHIAGICREEVNGEKRGGLALSAEDRTRK